MAYQFEGRIRYSEVGEDRKLTVTSLVDYFQDVSIFQSESCGVGLDYMAAHSLVWMTMFWQIDILRMPVLDESVISKTWPYDFNAFYGLRNFTLTTGAGECLARANSVWALIDTATQYPVKVPQEIADSYQLEEKLPMEYLPRKIRLEGEGRKMEPFSVGQEHLDTNHHVNNGQYILMAQQYLPEDFAGGRLLVEYKKQAHLNDRIVPCVYEKENTVTVSLNNEKEEPYAIVRLCAR